MKKFIRCRKGQGTTEYIVILAIAMGIALTIFWGPIKDKLKSRVTDISRGIEQSGR